MHNCRWLACHCGAPSADLTVCLLCPAATSSFSIGTCNSCFTTFTPANSRPAHPITDKANLVTLATHARNGNMSKFMPPSFNNAPHRVQALAIAPAPVPTLDADDFLEYYSESTPSSTLALREPHRPQFSAFRSPSHYRDPYFVPTPTQPLMMLPAHTLPGRGNALASHQLTLLGFSADLVSLTPTLTDPSHTTHALSFVDRRPTLTVQVITLDGATFIGIGFPPGSGPEEHFLIDTGANSTFVRPHLDHLLVETSAGETVTLGEYIEIPSSNTGFLPLRCFHTAPPMETHPPAPAPAPPSPTPPPNANYRANAGSGASAATPCRCACCCFSLGPAPRRRAPATTAPPRRT
jgi:hypothetical protein